LYNGQWIEPDTYQVVVGYGSSVSMGLLDFNKQLEVLVPKPEEEPLQIPHKLLIKDVFPGIYAISEDLDSKYVFADLGLPKNYWNTKPIRFRIEIKEKRTQMKPQSSRNYKPFSQIKSR
jgi:lipoprotein-releasing system permease protein